MRARTTSKRISYSSVGKKDIPAHYGLPSSYFREQKPFLPVPKVIQRHRKNTAPDYSEMLYKDIFEMFEKQDEKSFKKVSIPDPKENNMIMTGHHHSTTPQTQVSEQISRKRMRLKAQKKYSVVVSTSGQIRNRSVIAPIKDNLFLSMPNKGTLGVREEIVSSFNSIDSGDRKSNLLDTPENSKFVKSTKKPMTQNQVFIIKRRKLSDPITITREFDRANQRQSSIIPTTIIRSKPSSGTLKQLPEEEAKKKRNHAKRRVLLQFKGIEHITDY